MANINGTVQDQTLTSKTSTQLAQMHGTSPDPFQFRRGDGLERSVNMSTREKSLRVNASASLIQM